MYRKRTLPSSFTNTPYTPPRKRSSSINLTRPTSYRTNYQYQQYLKRKNLRTGGFLGKELKFVDYTYGINPVTSTWQLEVPSTGALNAVAQGSGESQRNGRKITNASLHIKGNFSLTTSRAHGVEVRIVVVKDNQTNGAALTPANVMTQGVHGFRNLEWVSRYTVLADKTYVLNPSITHTGTTNDGNAPIRPFSLNVNLSGTTSFDDVNADISDITDCAYQVISCCSAANAAQIQYQSRFRFYG